MRTLHLFLIVLAVTILYPGCDPSQPVITDEAAYIESIEEWQHARIERLKGATGWLNLAGLFWLEEGENSLSTMTMVIPKKRATTQRMTATVSMGCFFCAIL